MSVLPLPQDIIVFERGWLSSNNILLLGEQDATLVDSGYATHSEQTLALLSPRLRGRSLSRLINTHLHSDHCGGNAALQRMYPHLVTLIPPGQSGAVEAWDVEALSYRPTGQYCPRFSYDQLLEPGRSLRLGDRQWDIHAAPGHDPDSVILFQPDLRLLISADALWQNGFGVVFPEIEGSQAFDAVAATLDLIESLRPDIVIPGHGEPFRDLPSSLTAARNRLERFVQSPERHAWHAAKVLLKFKLLEQQRIDSQALQQWVLQTSYFALLRQNYFVNDDATSWIEALLADLLASGAIGQELLDGHVILVNR